MRIVYIELCNSSGGPLDSRVVRIPEGDNGDMLIQAAVLELAAACILNPGDAIRISEYEDG